MDSKIRNYFLVMIICLTNSCGNSFSNNYQISSKWIGNYFFSIGEKKDWRDGQSYQLSIFRDSIIFEGSGYQYYEKIYLNVKERNDTLYLNSREIQYFNLNPVFRVYNRNKEYYGKSSFIYAKKSGEEILLEFIPHE